MSQQRRTLHSRGRGVQAVNRTLDSRNRSGSCERMPYTFGYGSNMASRGLAAKGVRTLRASPARLRGWDLAFDVPSVFRKIEGGVANVVEGKGQGDHEVHGVVHEVDDEGLARLDGIEAVG